MKNSFLVCLLCCIGFSVAQIKLFGKCPALDVAANFNVTGYIGLWYENQKYPFLFELGAKCITATYGLQADGNITIFNQQIIKLTNKPNSINGTGRIVSNAKLAIKFPTTPGNQESPYWVLGTDYVNYAVVYSCRNSGLLASSRTAWILTRQRVPTNITLNAAFAVLDSRNVTRKFLKLTNQENC